MAGGISGLLVVGWIGFGAQVYVFGGGELYHDEKVISTDGCECLNSTATVEQLMGSPHE